VARHAALSGFDILQELSPESGDVTLLARSKGGSLTTIKVLIERAVPDDVQSALTREASLGARLGHEAVVKARALLLEPDFAAVVSEFVPGISLQRLLRFASTRGVRLPDVIAWTILERVLAALAHAHGHSPPIVHGGVSPSSIIVGWDGAVKLDDFGVARLRALVAPHIGKRDAATPIMAPEQASGSRATERSDVFTAALLAVRLATGRTPYARFRKSAAEMLLAMTEGNVAPLAKTRPDMADKLRAALDRALTVDPTKRDISAKELRDVVRASFDVDQGKAALVKLLDRWREQLETSVTPWERRASIPDDIPEGAADAVKAGTLALAVADDRPSQETLVATDDAPDEPWNKKSVPKEETALAATDPQTSLSRVGSVASDALTMPPLPPMRMTMPSLPTYGGPAVNVPPPAPKQFSGRLAALTVFILFVGLIAFGVIIFRWLLGPS
jgi:eukaryotic-like serine/threonine-protein kinase